MVNKAVATFEKLRITAMSPSQTAKPPLAPDPGRTVAGAGPACGVRAVDALSMTCGNNPAALPPRLASGAVHDGCLTSHVIGKAVNLLLIRLRISCGKSRHKRFGWVCDSCG